MFGLQRYGNSCHPGKYIRRVLNGGPCLRSSMPIAHKHRSRQGIQTRKGDE